MTGPDFAVTRCTDAARSGAIIKLVHLTFGALVPPSGALKETEADVVKRFAGGPVLIAEANGELVGSLFCALKGDGLYLTRMAVAPSRQGQSVGRALLAAAEAEARALNIGKLTLRVRLNLPRNRAYFERAGFTVTGQGQDPGRPPYEPWNVLWNVLWNARSLQPFVTGARSFANGAEWHARKSPICAGAFTTRLRKARSTSASALLSTGC
jgi:GNAT superfamily N-acetyltransferase